MAEQPLAPPSPYGDVSRHDVAAVLADLVHHPSVTRTILEITTGTPIAEAVGPPCTGAVRMRGVLAAPGMADPAALWFPRVAWVVEPLGS